MQLSWLRPVADVECFLESQWEIPPRTYYNKVQEDVLQKRHNASLVPRRQDVWFEVVLWGDKDWM